MLPVDRLAEMVEAGVVGSAAGKHISVMGYILDPTELLATTTPSIIQDLQSQKVDVLLLAPV